MSSTPAITPAAAARALPDDPSHALAASAVPGERGLPLLGHTLPFLFDTRRLMDGLRLRHGPNFQLHMFGAPVLVVGGPAEVREVLLDRERNFSSARGWQMAIGELFRGGLMLRDFDEHAVHRKIMQVAFRAAAMREYMASMAPSIEQSIARWPSTLDCYAALKQLTLDAAARVFLGLALGDEARALNEAFVAAVAASVAVIKHELPGLSFKRGMQGRRLLERFFRERIAERRAGSGSDMFSQLCRAQGDQGEQLSEQEIVDHMIFLMMAAHDTTTSSLSALVRALAEHPHWQARVRDELHAHGPAPLRWETRDALPLLDRCFNEALRMYPPAPFIARRTVRDCTLGGFHIPANTQLGVCALVTHRLPAYWPEPDRFDPDRFLPGRAEASAQAFFPFGGGAHTCIGLHFARLQVKAVMQALLTRFEVVLDGKPGRMLDVPIPKPRGGLPAKLWRI